MSYHIEINDYQRRLIMKALTSTDVNQFSQAPGSGDLCPDLLPCSYADQFRHASRIGRPSWEATRHSRSPTTTPRKPGWEEPNRTP
jgi:hypothetical protein